MVGEMNRDDIINMALEAGLHVEVEDILSDDFQYAFICNDDDLERFAALVAAAERERLAAKFMEMHRSQQHSNNYWHFAARKILEEA